MAIGMGAHAQSVTQSHVIAAAVVGFAVGRLVGINGQKEAELDKLNQKDHEMKRLQKEIELSNARTVER